MRPQLFERPLHEWSSHLFAPVHKKVCVVEWAGLQVARFRSRVDSLSIEPLSYEHLLHFAHFNGSRRNTAEDKLRAAHCSIIGDIESDRYPQHWEVKRATPAKLLVDGAKSVSRRQMDLSQKLIRPPAKIINA